MYDICFAVLITMASILLCSKYKCIESAHKYWSFFFLFLGIGYLFNALQADDKDNPITMTVQNKTKTRSKRLVHYYFEKIFDKKAAYHYEEGCRALKEAEEISLLIPNITDFEKSKFCLQNLVASACPGTPTIRLVVGIIAFCSQYGNMVMVEWQRFQSKLIEAKHHFELEEHYILSRNYAHDLYLTELVKKNK